VSQYDLQRLRDRRRHSERHFGCWKARVELVNDVSQQKRRHEYAKQVRQAMLQGCTRVEPALQVFIAEEQAVLGMRAKPILEQRRCHLDALVAPIVRAARRTLIEIVL
jgi:hypothetical protein